MIVGIGLIRIRNAQGNSRARKYVHPQNSTIRPARRMSSEERERNNSAPSCPTTRVHIASAEIGNPDQDGRRGSWARFCRSCQIIRAEKSGTKNPCEKLGSCHHCPTR